MVQTGTGKKKGGGEENSNKAAASVASLVILRRIVALLNRKTTQRADKKPSKKASTGFYAAILNSDYPSSVAANMLSQVSKNAASGRILRHLLDSSRSPEVALDLNYLE